VLAGGLAMIAAGLLWLVLYISAVYPAVVRMCTGCAQSISAQPPFDWGLGVLIAGIVLTFVATLARAVGRPRPKQARRK